MNLVETLKGNEEKLNKSGTYLLMKKYHDLVLKYPSSCIHYETEEKAKKREKTVSKGSDKLYFLHTKFTSVFCDFTGSVLLIQNDLPVNYMVKEVANFAALVDFLKLSTSKVNDVQELVKYYKDFTLKGKDLLDSLFKDLEKYSEEYNFTFDKKEVGVKFKELKIEFEIKLI